MDTTILCLRRIADGYRIGPGLWHQGVSFRGNQAKTLLAGVSQLGHPRLFGTLAHLDEQGDIVPDCDFDGSGAHTYSMESQVGAFGGSQPTCLPADTNRTPSV